MKHLWPTLLLLGLTALLVGQQSQSPPAKPPVQDRPFTGADVENLFKGVLDEKFTAGREVLVDVVTVPPNTALDRHWHPGEEFHYYLEGEPYVSIGGKPAVMAEQGTVGHIPFRAEHVLSTRGKAAKVVVFRVHTAGQPMRHLVGERKGG